IEKFRFSFAIGSIMALVGEIIKYAKKMKTPDEKKVLTIAVKNTVILLSPFAPHVCEEMWSLLGEKSRASVEKWPVCNEKLIDKKAEKMDGLVKKTAEDIREIIKLLSKDTEKIMIYVAPAWKHKIYLLALKKPKNLIAEVMNDSDMKKRGIEASKYAQQLMKTPVLYDVLTPKEEMIALENAVDLLKEEFGCDVKVVFADDSKSDKAGKAVPGKPGIEIF
ncbi:MAG: class I tRNA ligase family protein, partial [Candidatus Aenigmarchaeota archaeon]|nr:class I tRNA ligase family protein [Candidatus Aenigmarchaeota archaeon]